MIEYILGKYLVEKQKLTPKQYQAAIYAQNKVHVKLGLIAVSEGLMTKEQADKVNRLQAVMDKRFGDIAVEQGYLTPAQVKRLLVLQGNSYLSFVQKLENAGILTLTDIEETLEVLQREYGLTKTDIEIMKSDDIDKIIPLFLPTDDQIYVDIIGTILRMMVRLVDNHVFIGRAFFKEDYVAETIASQGIEGDLEVTVALAGTGESLLSLACPFAQEVFDTVNDDAIDAVGEFINNANGMFVSSLSHQDVTVELLPPEYALSRTVLEGTVLVVPCYIANSRIELVIQV